ncbi:4353_t:CDS:1, partial [Ambispora gerdemannii]
DPDQVIRRLNNLVLNGYFFSVNSENKISMYSLKTGDEKMQFNPHQEKSNLQPIRNVLIAMSRDKRLFAATFNDTIHLYLIENGLEIISKAYCGTIIQIAFEEENNTPKEKTTSKTDLVILIRDNNDKGTFRICVWDLSVWKEDIDYELFSENFTEHCQLLSSNNKAL